MNRKEYLKNMSLEEKAKEALKQNPEFQATLLAEWKIRGIKRDVSEQELEDMIGVTLIEGYEPDECEDGNKSLTLKEMEELGLSTKPSLYLTFKGKKVQNK
jgi:hypothetical protein